MAQTRKPSKATLAILQALLTAGDQACYGYALMKATSLKSGSLYPILARLKARGYLAAAWQISEIEGRPPRQTYHLTDDGRRWAREVVSAPTKPKTNMKKATP